MHLSRRGITALLGAGAALLLAAGTAGAQTTLAGETLTSPYDSLGTNGVCNSSGASTFTFSTSGAAAGPETGTFQESGTFTLASPSGPLTSFDATFTITPALGSPVTGTKSLVGTGGGTCTEFSGFATTSITGTTSYSTSAPFTETGTAPMALDQDPFATTPFLEGPFSPGAPGPNSKSDCKKGNYDQFGYKNQGQCVKAVNQSS
jgi:hypothetical protein